MRVRSLLLVGVLLGLLGTPAVHAGERASGSTWAWPLPGSPVVDRPFQPPASAWGAGHRGVDLLGEPGEPVLSAGPGRVTYAGLLAGRGVVTVTHAGGLRTTYEPVDASVSVGDDVGVGNLLGTLSTSHGSCRVGASCLHWGLKRGRAYLDPLGLVVAGKLQLLPINAKAPRVKDDKLRDLEKDKEKLRKAKKQFKRFRKMVGNAAKKTGRAVGKVAKQTGRVVTRSGKAVIRVVVRRAPMIARFAARQAARSAVAAAATAAAPEVLVAVGVVVVVGGIVYVARR